MKAIIDILLFPSGLVIEAFVGILYPVESEKMRRHRKWAIISLVGCIGVFGLVFLSLATTPPSVGLAPLIAVGLILMFAFLIAGRACAVEAESTKKKRNDS
jgi:hypothetical protein